MKLQELRQMIREEVRGVILEAKEMSTQKPKPTPSYSKPKLAKQASDLYEKMVNTLDSYDLNTDAVDDEMEIIVKKVGYTPEQKKKPRRKFTFGEHPEFETLTDEQLTKIIPFLKAVIKIGGFEIYDDWDGTKIVTDMEGVEDEYGDN